MYQLAVTMVPGAVNRVSNKRLKDKPDGVPPVVKPDPIHQYMPDILKALSERNLADVDMLLMALATIRVETKPAFTPSEERRSKLNTAPDKILPETGLPISSYPDGLYDQDPTRTRLGNKWVGDGETFKGRGFIQLTGRYNYTDMSKKLNMGTELVDHPEEAYYPDVAAAILAEYLKKLQRPFRQAMIHEDLMTARKLVNSKGLGYEEFKTSFNAGRAFLKLKVITKAKTAKAKSSSKAG